MDCTISSTQYELQVGYLTDTTKQIDYANGLLWGSGTTATFWALPGNPFDGQWHYLRITSVGETVGSTIIFDDIIVALTRAPTSSATIVPALQFPGRMTGVTFGGPSQGENGLDLSNSGTVGRGFVGDMAQVALYTSAPGTMSVFTSYALGQVFMQNQYGATEATQPQTGRLNQIMNILGLNSNLSLSVPYQFRTYLYGESSNIATVSTLNYVQTLALSEPGIVFQGPDGIIYGYNREYQYLAPKSLTSQGTFGDAASVSLHYDGPSLAIHTDDLDVWNTVQVRSGLKGAQIQEVGPSTSSIAATSASVSGARTLQGMTSLQMRWDLDALAIAQNYLNWYETSRIRVGEMTLHSYSSAGSVIPQMLGRGLMDRITVQYYGGGGGTALNQDYLIEGISDDFTMEEMSWTTKFALSPYELTMKATYIGTWTFGTPSSSAVLTL
jgi:hypothetical protein